jgi:hypothetical protein
MKKLLKYLLPLPLAFSFITISSTQVPPWQQASQWTIYNVRGAKFYKISLDSLDKYHNRPLNDDSMRTFLSQSSALPSDKPLVWMGAFVTSCIIDHQRRKIDISSYGGFFFDETDKKFYTIPQEIQKDWLNYLASCAGSVSGQK